MRFFFSSLYYQSCYGYQSAVKNGIDGPPPVCLSILLAFPCSCPPTAYASRTEVHAVSGIAISQALPSQRSAEPADDNSRLVSHAANRRLAAGGL